MWLELLTCDVEIAGSNSEWSVLEVSLFPGVKHMYIAEKLVTSRNGLVVE